MCVGDVPGAGGVSYAGGVARQSTRRMRPDEVGKCYYDWARRLHHRGEEVYIVEVVVCGEGGGGSCGSRRPVSRSTRKSLMNRGGNHVSSERVRDLLLKQWPLIVVCILAGALGGAIAGRAITRSTPRYQATATV